MPGEGGEDMGGGRGMGGCQVRDGGGVICEGCWGFGGGGVGQVGPEGETQ